MFVYCDGTKSQEAVFIIMSQENSVLCRDSKQFSLYVFFFFFFFSFVRFFDCFLTKPTTPSIELYSTITFIAKRKENGSKCYIQSNTKMRACHIWKKIINSKAIPTKESDLLLKIDSDVYTDKAKFNTIHTLFKFIIVRKWAFWHLRATSAQIRLRACAV